MRSGETFVAVESFRPHWDRLIASRRVTIDAHPTVARAMRITSERRETISLKIVDQFLTDAGEPHVLQILYLVDREGVPLSKPRPRKPRKPRRKKPVPDLIGNYKAKGKQRGIAFSGSGPGLGARV